MLLQNTHTADVTKTNKFICFNNSFFSLDFKSNTSKPQFHAFVPFNSTAFNKHISHTLTLLVWNIVQRCWFTFFSSFSHFFTNVNWPQCMCEIEWFFFFWFPFTLFCFTCFNWQQSWHSYTVWCTLYSFMQLYLVALLNSMHTYSTINELKKTVRIIKILGKWC